jgi:hypothetical protein
MNDNSIFEPLQHQIEAFILLVDQAALMGRIDSTFADEMEQALTDLVLAFNHAVERTGDFADRAQHVKQSLATLRRNVASASRN